MRRSLLVAAVAAGTLSVAACTGTNTGATGTTTGTASGTATATATAGSTVSGDASVVWVDKVCSEVLQIMDAQTTPLPTVSTTDAQQAVTAVETFVEQNLHLVDDAIAGLKDVGEPPVANGDQAVDALVDGLEALRQAYERVKDKFAAVGPNDPQGAQAAMFEALASLSEAGEELNRAVQVIDSNQHFAQAAQSAPSCQTLRDSVVPATTVTTTTT